ncbi:hypothetical protein RF55_9461 [Lasius niger]|uniref:Gag-pol polyprotein n=1 Tax=Lasius niger TaxID=67767 RepID=A0A0J7KKJ2_LASNI|nr:hypothetical protein RF55_9912 [Lasius niger]KMQ90749.1 hypothetical protein RF55_9461 [Lasius niger]
MGASAVGALGLNCLKTANYLRGNKCEGINGRINGQIKRKMEKAMDVINTLIYKAEAAGDPALLKIKNRELSAQVKKLKLNEVLMKREVEEMRHMMEDLKKEVSDLKDKLDDSEEDRRKARDSYKIVQYKLSKLRREVKLDTEVPAETKDKVDVPEDIGSQYLPENLPIKQYKVSRKSDSDPDPVVAPLRFKSGTIRKLEDTNNTGGSETNRSNWTKVQSRKGRPTSRKSQGVQRRDPHPASRVKVNNNTRESRQTKTVRRPPRTAAVMITDRQEEFSYLAAPKKARESISLRKLEIEQTKIRKAANGGLLIEVLGPDDTFKAAALRDKLREMLPPEQASVTRPVAKGEIRFIGLDCTTSSKDVLDVVWGVQSVRVLSK